MTKTPFSVNDDARPHSSRRALLRGLAISPIAIAAGAATGAGFNHAALLQLEAQAKDLNARTVAHSRDYGRVHKEWRRLCGRHPRHAMKWRLSESLARSQWRYDCAVERFEDRKEAMKGPSGMIAHDELGKALKKEGEAIGELLRATPAADIEGLRIKARIAYSGHYYPATRAIYEDLLGPDLGSSAP
jgi:hypothetical protein